jgi:hypothetical protein
VPTKLILWNIDEDFKGLSMASHEAQDLMNEGRLVEFS